MVMKFPSVIRVRMPMAFCCILALASQARSEGILAKVVTYNLHHGQGKDSLVDLARIARVLNSLDPDIAGLQEIDSVTRRTGLVDQPAVYARLTGLHGVFGKAQDFQGGSYGNLTLSKTPARRSSRLELPGPEPRIALFTDIDLSGGANPSAGTVTVINTHLMFANAQDPGAALRSARFIDSVVSDRRNGDPGRPMILVGDMNASDGTPVINEFLKIWQSAPFGTRVDRIFYWPANRWKYLGNREIGTGDAKLASDHFPQLQTMELLLSAVGLLPREPAAREQKGGLVFQGGILRWVAPGAASGAAGLPDVRGRYLQTVFRKKHY
jgi:endonuclease/exonuclease/phosphatase family metal-dependent hydrolase